MLSKMCSLLNVVGIILLALLVLASVPAAAQVQETDDVAYGPDPEQKLDYCILPESQIAGKSVLLLIHGGGWHAGDKRGHRVLCRLAAEHGLLGVTINYRLATGSPDTLWPVQLVDVISALRWLRAHAALLGINPGRICSYGDSAGGHLSTFLAVRHEVACAIDGFGPVDLTNYHTPVKLLFGSEPLDTETLLKKEHLASPVFYVDQATAPLMIIQGTMDKGVPPSQSQELVEALHKVGITPQFISYEGGHEFKGLSREERQEINEKIIGFVISTTASLH